MNNILIYIENQLVDLSPGTAFALTFQAMKIGDLRSRVTNFSNQVRLPSTPNNKRVFEHCQNIHSNSSLPYRTAKAKVLVNGIEVIREGVALLEGFNDGFKVTILSAVRDFFDLIGEDLISDLDTDDINSAFDAVYIESRATATEDVVCPVIDYGMFTEGNSLNTDYYLPSFYYKSVIDRIIRATGYQKSGAIFSDEKYNKLIIPSTFGYTDAFRRDKEFSAAIDSVQVINLDGSEQTEISFLNILFNGSDNYFNGTRYSPAALDYFYYYHLSCDLIINVVVTGTVAITVSMRANSSTYDQSEVISSSGKYIISLRSENTVDHIPAGGGIDPKRISIQQFGSGSSVITISIGRFSNEVLPYFDRGNKVFFGQLLPRITKKDLIRDFMIRFGQLVKEENGVLIFMGIRDIIQNRDGAVEWTAKRDTSAGEEIAYEIQGYTQTNTFTYPGVEYLNKDTGKGELIVGSNTQKTSNFVESIFMPAAPSVHAGILTVLIPVYMPDEEMESGESVDPNEFQDAGNRLLLVRNKYSEEPDVTYDTAISDYLVGYFEDPQADHQLGWQSFINTYYAGLTHALAKPKVVTRYYRLTALDIAQLDLFRLVYDSGDYYLINTVENYVPGEVTKVELFKVS